MAESQPASTAHFDFFSRLGILLEAIRLQDVYRVQSFLEAVRYILPWRLVYSPSSPLAKFFISHIYGFIFAFAYTL